MIAVVCSGGCCKMTCKIIKSIKSLNWIVIWHKGGSRRIRRIGLWVDKTCG